jgi:hypothetical protein
MTRRQQTRVLKATSAVVAFVLAASAQVGSGATSPAAANGAAKAATCRALLSDAEVRQVTGLANMALKPYDATQTLNRSEAHCRFEAGATTIEIAIRSRDQLSVYDTLYGAIAGFKPVTIDVPGATATFFDLGGRGTNFSGYARTSEHGVSIAGTVDGPRIADPKGTTRALLRLVLSRI